MSGKTNLWDTNAVIYFLNNSYFSQSTHDFFETIKQTVPHMSFITELELLCWNTNDEKEYQRVEEFVANSVIVGMDNEIKKQTIKIRKTSKIKLPDAIIAATSRVNKCVLITKNIQDFKNVNDLEIVNPFSDKDYN